MEETTATVIEPEETALAVPQVDTEEIKQLILGMQAEVEKCLASAVECNASDEALGAMPYDDLKRIEQSLSKDVTNAGKARKEFKAHWDAPRKAVEEAFNAAISDLTVLHSRYKAERVARDDKRAKERYALLRDAYLDYAPALAERVEFDQVFDPKWLNGGKSWSAVKASEQMERRVSQVASDWEQLKSLRDSMPFFDEAERELFRSLSLNDAIAKNKQLVDEKAQMDAMKAQVEEAMEWRERHERVPMEAYPEAAPQTAEEVPEFHVYTFTVKCTAEQFEGVKAYLKSKGIHGSVKGYVVNRGVSNG